MPRSSQASIGRTVIAVFDHGEDFYTALNQVCAEHQIRQGYIPAFIAGFATVDLVGTCQRLEDPQAPVWTKVQLANIEALGGGTLAWDDTADRLAPHIHVAVGLKEQSATGHTSHLLDATVQFLTEITIVEILTPKLTRRKDPSLYDVPLLNLRGQNQAP